MKKLLVMAVVGLAWGTSAPSAQAFCTHPCWTCCAPPVVVMTYRPDWRQEKVEILVPKVDWKEQVNKVPVDTWVPKWDTEKRAFWHCTYEPRNVVYNVPRCRWVPCVWIDPCSCCPLVTYRPEWYWVQVPGVVNEPKWIQRIEAVPVCRWEVKRDIVEQRCWVPVWTTEKAFTVRSYCVMVPVPVTVAGPCCPPPVVPVYHHHHADSARFMWYLNW